LNAQILRNDSKVLIHLQKIDPTKPFGNLKIDIVKIKERNAGGNNQHFVTQMGGSDQYMYMSPTTYSYGAGGMGSMGIDNDDDDHDDYNSMSQMQCNKCQIFND